MKKCSACGEIKPLESFYKHPQTKDGHVNKCKTCTTKAVSANYRANIEHYTEYERKRQQDPQRRANASIYGKTRRDKNKVQNIANHLTSNAIRDKRLIRQPCEICGEAIVEAHHEDYYKPLEVQWLCKKHHLEKHGKVLRS